MRPPICAVCKTKFSPDAGALVSFATDPADDEWYERAKQPGFVGHPPHKEWFCKDHKDAALALKALTRRAAVAKLGSGA